MSLKTADEAQTFFFIFMLLRKNYSRDLNVLSYVTWAARVSKLLVFNLKLTLIVIMKQILTSKYINKHMLLELPNKNMLFPSCCKILWILCEVCRMDTLIVITPFIVTVLSERLRRLFGNQFGHVRTGSNSVEGKKLKKLGQCYWWKKYFFRSCMREKYLIGFFSTVKTYLNMGKRCINPP